MFHSTQNTVVEKEIPEDNKYSTDIIKDLTTWTYSNVTPKFEENVASLLQEKKNLDKNDILLFHLKRKLMQMENINLEDNLKITNALTCSRISFEHLKTSFYPILEEMMDYKISSNTLADEIVLNTHIASKRHLKKPEIHNQKIQDWSYKVNNILKNDFLEQPPALDFANDNNNENQKLSLLCVFTNETGKEVMSEDFNNLSHDEDIKMILPRTWNIVVAQNVLTISDENNQDITMCFRSPLKARFDYKNSRKKFKCKSSMDVITSCKERFQNSRKKKLNSPFTKATLKQVFEPVNWTKNKSLFNSPTHVRNEETRRNSFLLLQEPLLFNCIEQNRIKQMLMYKAHSVESIVKDGSKSNCSKTLEQLLAKSIQYDGEPVYLVSEPLKLMTRLKKEEIRGLSTETYHKCKHNLIRSSVYKILQQYKNAHMLRNTQFEKQLIRTVPPKNECAMQISTINEIPYEPAKITRSCLDLPKNFATSFIIKDFDVSEYTFQETFKNQMLSEPFFGAHSCSNLAKNFSSSVTRGSFDVDGLFGGHKSDFHRRMNITALKHVNVKKLVSSVFRHFFHFYSVLGGNLRSGTVITRSSSNYWLQVAGVAKDSCTLRLAGELFTTLAGKKVVLNIFDYIKFLIVFARTRRLIIAEVVKQMMVCEEISELEFSKGKCKRCRTLKNQEKKSTEFSYERHYSQTSTSLPNI